LVVTAEALAAADTVALVAAADTVTLVADADSEASSVIVDDKSGSVNTHLLRASLDIKVDSCTSDETCLVLS